MKQGMAANLQTLWIHAIDNESMAMKEYIVDPYYNNQGHGHESIQCGSMP